MSRNEIRSKSAPHGIQNHVVRDNRRVIYQLYTAIYIYIDTERERERERECLIDGIPRGAFLGLWAINC